MAMFDIGDVVTMKSGGPKMTVARMAGYEDDQVYEWKWFAGTR